MKYYKNIDLMPIYQAFVLIAWMTSGLFLLNEAELYNYGELLRLLFSICFVIFGIAVIAMKTNE